MSALPEPIARVLHKIRRNTSPGIDTMIQYGHTGDPVTEFDNDLERYFWTTPGRLSHKWHHYFAI